MNTPEDTTEATRNNGGANFNREGYSRMGEREKRTAIAPEPWAELETISPAYARELLALNEKNRKVNPAYVEFLVGVLDRDEWRLNGETIVLSSQFKLLDGQHRLTAIGRANKPVRSFVVYNIEPLAQLSMDQGAKRSNSAQLGLMDEKDTHGLASAISWYVRYKEGKMRASGTNARISIHRQVEVLEQKPQLREATRWGHNVHNAALGMPRAVAAAFYVVFSEINEDAADGFFYKLVEGADIRPGHPVHTLQKALRKDLSRPSSAGRMTTARKAAIMVKAWNDYRAGRDRHLLKWLDGEPFPTAQ